MKLKIKIKQKVKIWSKYDAETALIPSRPAVRQPRILMRSATVVRP